MRRWHQMLFSFTRSTSVVLQELETDASLFLLPLSRTLILPRVPLPSPYPLRSSTLPSLPLRSGMRRARTST